MSDLQNLVKLIEDQQSDIANFNDVYNNLRRKPTRSTPQEGRLEDYKKASLLWGKIFQNHEIIVLYGESRVPEAYFSKWKSILNLAEKIKNQYALEFPNDFEKSEFKAQGSGAASGSQQEGTIMTGYLPQNRQDASLSTSERQNIQDPLSAAAPTDQRIQQLENLQLNQFQPSGGISPPPTHAEDGLNNYQWQENGTDVVPPTETNKDSQNVQDQAPIIDLTTKEQGTSISQQSNVGQVDGIMQILQMQQHDKQIQQLQQRQQQKANNFSQQQVFGQQIPGQLGQSNLRNSTTANDDIRYQALPPTSMPAPIMNNFASGAVPTVDANAMMWTVMNSMLQQQQQMAERMDKEKEFERQRADQPRTRTFQPNIRVPEVSLPTFKEEKDDYQAFKKQFQSTVKPFDMDDVQKFILLRSKMTGDALLRISALEPEYGSYDAAWAILDDCYDNVGASIFAIYSNIESIKPISTGKAETYLPLIHSFKNAQHLFEAHGLEPENLVLRCMLWSKLDEPTREKVQTVLIVNQRQKQLPLFAEMIPVIQQQHANAKATLPMKVHSQQQQQQGKKPQQATRSHATVAVSPAESTQKRRPIKCFLCSEPHGIFDCAQWHTTTDKISLLKSKLICIYCAKHKFNRDEPCKKREHLKCNICQGQHITSLHPTSSTTSMLTGNSSQATEGPVILPLADATIVDEAGTEAMTTAIVDWCSQRSYVTTDFVNKLSLKKKKTSINVLTVGGKSTKIRHQVDAQLKLKDGSLIPFNALVTKSLSEGLPRLSPEMKKRTHSKGLADSSNPNARINVLIGADIIPNLILPGMETVNGLVFQQTRLGYIVFGKNPSEAKRDVNTFTMHTEDDQMSDYSNADDDGTSADPTESIEAATSHELEQIVHRVFDSLESPFKEEMNVDEIDYCEKLHQEKHTRDADGRYREPLPFKPDASPLGESYETTKSQFFAIERKLQNNPKYLEAHHQCFQQYIELGHLVKVPFEEERAPATKVYYMPYHPVIKEDKVTTKYRIVFNASHPTSNGVSFNDTLLQGPKLQTAIPDVITRARQFKFFFTADIAQMYRMVKLLDEDSDRMRIFYRPNRDEPVAEYRMTTVTFGVAAAPYQALRTIQQIADDNAPNPEILAEIKEGIYVDDYISGSDTIEDGQLKIQQVSDTFAAGKMQLTKFSANDERLLHHVPKEHRLESIREVDAEAPVVKTLGLNYNAKNDCFEYQFNAPKKLKITKRGILSLTASLYDPLGFILPVIMGLRMLIQALWMNKLNWDEKIDEDFQRQFMRVYEQLKVLANVRVPRWTGKISDGQIELIGFADASMDGYAAVVYSRVREGTKFRTTLLASRGKVTPVKTKTNKENRNITIPKLELEGVVMLAQLFKDLARNIQDDYISWTAYTDSEIVLAWIRSHKEIDNKFVRRRAAKILKVISPSQIHHVRSADNPADIASRGAQPEAFVASKLWFEGPVWLKDDTLPKSPFTEQSTALLIQEEEISSSPQTKCREGSHGPFINPINRYSSLLRGLRVLSWCYRLFTAPKTLHIPLTAEEIQSTRKHIFKWEQSNGFEKELKILQSGKYLPKHHWMSKLAPFINKDGLIAVGGRLDQAKIPEMQKHPILIPKGHLANLLIHNVHIQQGHSDNTLTECLLRQEVWIPAAKQAIKKLIHNCPTCIRWRRQVQHPMMGDLPAVRLTPAPVFAKSGVDLSGPYQIKSSNLRNAKIIKVWIAVFVCMVSKAVHLELCSDLTTDKFLEAFLRFTGRRGTPSLMMSDRGSNFIGANRQLQETFIKVMEKSKEHIATRGIAWAFNVAHTPHAGGLWEACVKSFKYFMRRINGGNTLTYESFNTLLCRIEGLMNSRPLCALPSSPQDPDPLTPFHFIAQRKHRISAADYTRPERGLATRRWLINQDLLKSFWKRFQTEYLNTLQKRSKWLKPQEPIQVGDLVLIKEPNLRPGDWKRGLVMKLLPDKKGETRRVEIKTARLNRIQRSVHNLVLLRNIVIEDVWEVSPSPASLNSPEKSPVSSSLHNERESDASSCGKDQSQDILISSSSDGEHAVDRALSQRTHEKSSSVISSPSSTERRSSLKHSKSMSTEAKKSTEAKISMSTEAENSASTNAKILQTNTKPENSNQKNINNSPILEAEEASKPSADNNQRPRRIKKAPVYLNPSIWLMLITLIQGGMSLQITPIVPGVQIQELGPALLKAIDLEFAVTTNLNVTGDLQAIKSQVSDFHQFCTTIAQEDIRAHCDSLFQQLERQAEEVRNAILSEYPSERTSRSVGSVIKIAGPILYKIATPALLTAGLAYTAVENERLKGQIKTLQSKIVSISTVMLNVSEIQFDSIDNELGKLIEEQNRVLLEVQLNEFHEVATENMRNILNAHLNVHLITPMEQLQKQVELLNQNHSSFYLPAFLTPKQLFNLHPVQKYLKEQVVIVKFTIPLVRAGAYRRVRLINIPTEAGKAVELLTNHPVSDIVLNAANLTYFDTTKSSKLGSLIHENFRFTATTRCMREILAGSSTVPSCKEIVNASWQGVYHLELDESLVLEQTRPIVFACKDNVIKKVINEAALVKHPNCIIKVEESDEEYKLHEEITISAAQRLENFTKLNHHLDQFHQDERVQQLTTQLRKELNEDWLKSASSPLELEKTLIIIGSVVTGVIIIIGIGVACYRRKSRAVLPRSPFSSDELRDLTWIADFYRLHHSTPER